jgi:hypothetical protein
VLPWLARELDGTEEARELLDSFPEEGKLHFWKYYDLIERRFSRSW